MDVRVVDPFDDLEAVKDVIDNSPVLAGNDTAVTAGDVSLLDGLDIDLKVLGITVDPITAMAPARTGAITDVPILR